LLGQKQYSLGVDIWAVGCIFAELTEKKPLFCGDSEIDQIFKIFQFHGTPTPAQWSNIRNYLVTQTAYRISKLHSPNSRESTLRPTSKTLIKMVWIW
jgi:serine/threonine protein kinase